MKKTIILILAAMSLLPAAAQDRLVTDGFYRVQNYGSKRFAYIYDCSGGINYANTSADMGAIVLDKRPEKRFTDPASVVYASSHGKNGSIYLYDLEAQGTSVYKIINYYVTVSKGNVANTFWVYEPNYNLYLWDELRNNDETSYVGTDPTKNSNTGATDNNYRCWSILPVSANTDEYLAIASGETHHVGNKYYKPYYLAFAFDFASSGMKAYYVSDVKEDAVIIAEVKGTVPAATPVIVECSATEPSSNRVELLHASPAKLSGNKLSGNYFCYKSHGETGYRAYDPATMRLLAVKNGRLCYITDTEMQYCTRLEFINGKKTTYKYCLNANESFLTVPAGSADELPVMTQAEYDALHPLVQKGDINGDGQINSTDALVLNRIVASGKTAAQNPEADINGDGQVNSTDALVLNRIIASGK